GELAPGRDRAVGQRLVDGFGQGDGDPAAGRGVVVGDTHERGGGQGGDLADRVVAGDLNQVTAGQRAPRRERPRLPRQGDGGVVSHGSPADEPQDRAAGGRVLRDAQQGARRRSGRDSRRGDDTGRAGHHTVARRHSAGGRDLV